MQRTQHLDLFVADRFRAEVDRRLHRGQRDQLQQVVLEDVADDAGLLVVRGAVLDPDRLRDGDLDVVDELAVPDRLEDAVREPQRQHVLDGLLAEVVVDAEDLGLVELLGEQGVQLLGRLEVVAERLLDHEPVPAVLRAPLADLLDERADHRRRDGEVVDAVSARPEVLVHVRERPRDLGPARVVAEVHVEVAHRFGQGLPDVLAERIARVLLDRRLHVLAELVVGAFRARVAEHGEVARQQLSERERVERREELLVRQVARRRRR